MAQNLPDSAILNGLIPLCQTALQDVDAYLAAAKDSVRANIVTDGRVSGAALEAEQAAAHGFAWIATYAQALKQLLSWSQLLDTNSKFGKFEQLTLQIGFGEYLSQLKGGIPISQGEITRPGDFDLQDASHFTSDASRVLMASGNSNAARKTLVGLMEAYEGCTSFGNAGLDEEYGMIADQFRKFIDEKVVPFAHGWHMRDELIPIEIVQEIADLGVFGLTIPENLGGLGMGKLAMCVVTEELARGYIGVGSLGTRGEIAGELILGGGTPEQQEKWLPLIASGEILPTAVFTEPNTGSDLGSLRTRAVMDGENYVITGNKTWITHAARSDIMTMLVRTNPDTTNHKGLSMMLAEKPRGTEADPFPAEGMSGSEIEVLGYRGMKEYELGFDGFKIKAENLLGGVEGQGFNQLMKTFEAARIQTAARAVGVAQNALEVSLKYARDRQQFGKSLIEFPRVYNKLAMMAVEIMIARQLSYFAAQEKDAGIRCDLEAGMAKLLGARVAWACADNGVQIHGGNGFAVEYEISRILCDARILSIFEGAAEIQANVIVRRLIEV